MKRSRFSEEQIIQILNEAQAGLKVPRAMSQTWHFQCYILQMEGKIWRP
jgi:hypothetical protein